MVSMILKERDSMEKTLTKRASLCNRTSGKPKVVLDMEEVYDYIDKGHTAEQAANHFGVSESTLRRHHEEHQKNIEAMEEEHDTSGLTPPVNLSI